MVSSILELLGSTDKKAPEVTPVAPATRRRVKGKKSAAAEVETPSDGASSFGVTAKLKDINKKVIKKKMAQEDMTQLDPEFIHQQKLAYFQSLQDSLPSLREQLGKVTKVNERNELQRKIQAIENHEEETEYLLNTAHILARYCDPTFDQDTSENQVDAKNLSQFVMETKESARKDKLGKQYLAALDPLSYPIDEHLETVKDVCRNCDGEEFVPWEGEQCCVVCGYILPNSKDMLHFSFKEMSTLSMQPNPTYKKINHFNEWLNSVTNRSTSVVPDVIIQAIQKEMEKDQITDPTELDKKTVRLYLKRLGQSKYYDSSASIICTIAKIPPLNMPLELEAQLRDMFKQIQGPYERVKPPTRSSFLSYSYVIHQMLKLLDYPEFLSAFPLLKSQDKLRQQDQIWEGICNILDWLYIPTI